MLFKIMARISKIFVAFWILAFHNVDCIQIENQLKVITNDCYERLAIGHRLSSRDLYKTVDAKTVPKCQQECTNEGDTCKAFSYGIAVKGNSTCELGKYFIRETADLQPIGTTNDVDFDLYIKKLGCKLVIDPHVNKISRPNFNTEFLPHTTHFHDKYQKPTFISTTTNYPNSGDIEENINQKPKKSSTNAYEDPELIHKPTPPTYGIGIPSTETHKDESAFDNNKKGSESYPKFTHNMPSNYGVQHVQGSLISISTGPRNYLHPVHEILIGKNPYLYYKHKSNPTQDNISDESDDIYKIPSYSYNDVRPYNQFSYVSPNGESKNVFYGSSNQYFNYNLNSGNYDVQNKFGNPSVNKKETQKPHNYYERPHRPGYFGEPNEHHRISNKTPTLEYFVDAITNVSSNHYNSGSNQFDHNDDRIKLNSYNNKPFSYKPLNPYERPQEYVPSYNNRQVEVSSAYNKESFHSLSDINSKKHFIPQHNRDLDRNPYNENSYDSFRKSNNGHGIDSRQPTFQELYSFRPMDFNRPYYNERLHRPQHTGNSYYKNPTTIDDRMDERPPYSDHVPQSEEIQGKPVHGFLRPPLRSNYNEPSRPDEESLSNNSKKPSNLEYLFDENGKYDIVLNSTRVIHLNSSSVHRNNGTYNLDDLKTSPYHEPWSREPNQNESSAKSVVAESTGVDGEKIISIITQLDSACFKRVLAGKRVSRRFVKRFLLCERVEDCQLECGEEKNFVCEGFNYRLDSTGHGKGACELLDVPLHRLDIRREVYPDREYDYYERDRNTARTHCRAYPPYPDYGVKRLPGRPLYHHLSNDRRSSYVYSQPLHKYDRGSYEFNRRTSYYDKSDYYMKRPLIDQYRRRTPDYDNKRVPYYGPDNERHGDIPHHFSHHTEYGQYSGSYINRNDNINYGIHYSSPNPSSKPIFSPTYDNKPLYSKPYNYGLTDNKNYDKVDFDNHKFHDTDIYRNYNRNPYTHEKKNYYLPPRVGGTKDWGQYGGSYGNFGHDYDQGSYNELIFNSWSLDNRNDHKPDNGFKPADPLLPPYKPGSYLPNNALEIHLIDQGQNINNIRENFNLPAEPRLTTNSYSKEECSLRSATGFKLGRAMVKKFYVVPNIYDCELLCFKERSFTCASYAFRYTISLSSPADNCYLSNKNYKELDYYTDLLPDRDFDIYTMNNPSRCVSPVITSRDSSDWPHFELDTRNDFLLEPGFEIYDRGSFGHGCEHYHFDVWSGPPKNHDMEADQLCYIGFGSPSRILPQAVKKTLRVESLLDCKAECSKLKEESLFQCMSFSYRENSYDGSNCFLSDIYQRDLLLHIDYVHDPNSRLFAWDNYNPQCTILTNKRIRDNGHNHIGREETNNRFPERAIITALDTWRAYSVSGWPCKRGHLCKKNLEAGFWFCKLEGGDVNSWDYCCRPDHQCGYSYGFSYPWCYVGSEKTQWRECSDQYYPYIHNLIDRFDEIHSNKNYQIASSLYPWEPNQAGVATDYSTEYEVRPSAVNSPSVRPGFRPDRPPLAANERPSSPSLDEYELHFHEQFLAPPKPGGFGQPRHWPVAYLHKDKPPNITDSKPELSKFGRNEDSKFKLSAIQSLIDIINSNELKNVQYQITNQSNVKDDILYVKIPLPTNFTKQDPIDNMNRWSKPNSTLESVDTAKSSSDVTQKSEDILHIFEKSVITSGKQNFSTLVPAYRRSYITRANISTHGRSTLSKGL